MNRFIFWFVPLILFLFSCCSSSSQPHDETYNYAPSTNKPAPSPSIHFSPSYTLFSSEDESVGERKRISARIGSSASTFEDRAHVLMNAARDLQRSTGANVVEVFLELSPLLSGKGYSLGVARFAPDGKGFSGYEQWKWEVQATDIQISQQEIAIAELWWQNRDSFQTRNGTTDEQRLSKFIANKLHISPSQVHLPLTLINWRDYPVAQ